MTAPCRAVRVRLMFLCDSGKNNLATAQTPCGNLLCPHAARTHRPRAETEKVFPRETLFPSHGLNVQRASRLCHGVIDPKGGVIWNAVLGSPVSRDLALLLFAPVLLHHGASRDFFGTLAVATGALRGLFDVFVLTLLLFGRAADVTFDCHNDVRIEMAPSGSGNRIGQNLRITIFPRIGAVMFGSSGALCRTASAGWMNTGTDARTFPAGCGRRCRPTRSQYGAS